MYEGLKHAHSGLRWVLLFLLIATVVKAFSSSPSRRLSTWTLGMMHVQVIIGLVLYFFLSPMTKDLAINMKNSVLRFYGVEHIMGMIIAAILVTIGHVALKSGRIGRHKWMYLVGLVVLLLSIPWPMRIPSAGWF